MKGKKRIIILLLVLIVIAGVIFTVVLLTGKGKNSGTASSSDGEQILTLEVKEGTVSVVVEGPSIVEPYRSQDIRSKTAGNLIFAPFEGDEFKSGEVLFRFDRSDQEEAVKQAELNLSQARLDLRKAQLSVEKSKSDLADKERLLKGGAVPQVQVTDANEAVVNAELAVEIANLKIEQSELLLEKARSELEGTVVYAPFEGIVLKSYANSGDVVSSSSMLMTFSDVSRVRLQAEVDEFDIGKIEPGMAVTITADTLGEDTLKSKVERISPAAEVINNISIFKVSTLLTNTDNRLRPGMSADLSILIRSDRGVVVPNRTVSTVRERSYIKVYENGEVVTKRVTIGADDGVNIAVIEGLEVGAIIVLPTTAGFTLTATQSSTGTSIVPITVPGTGGAR